MAGWIIFEAIKKLIGGQSCLKLLVLVPWCMVIAAINTFVSMRLYKVAHETNSVALEADALHLRTDVYTSLGVAAGLGLILLTGMKWLDPIVANFSLRFFIIFESFELLRKAFSPTARCCLEAIRGKGSRKNPLKNEGKFS